MGLLLVSLVTFSIFFTRTGARQTVLPLSGNEDFGLSAGLLGLIFAMMALGTGISGPAPAAYAADVIPAQARGMGMGLFRTYSDIGFVVGPLMLGWIADATGGFAWPLAFNAALMASGALAFGLFAKETVAPRQDGSAAT